jgi:polyhydroxybutyrate depolymerase
VRVGEAERSFLLYVPPPAARSTQPAPLLLAFHGTGESGREMHRTAGLARHADRAGFLVAYPDAAVGNWAEGCSCTRADQLGVNDTGFVRALVADVATRYPVDRARVVAVGFSQGGLFVHRLACELADVVTAVASIAAPMSTPLAQRCRPARPVSVLVVMGTLDDAYPYEGRAAGDRSTLGARATAAFWRTLDRCGPMRDRAPRPPGADPAERVIGERWSECAGGAGVALYTVEGGRHAWRLAEGFDAAAVVAGLLER